MNDLDNLSILIVTWKGDAQPRMYPTSVMLRLGRYGGKVPKRRKTAIAPFHGQ